MQLKPQMFDNVEVALQLKNNLVNIAIRRSVFTLLTTN